MLVEDANNFPKLLINGITHLPFKRISFNCIDISTSSLSNAEGYFPHDMIAGTPIFVAAPERKCVQHLYF
jgi:hypothetical protein